MGDNYRPGLARAEKGEYRAGWERQLVRKDGPQHVLRGLTGELLARRFDTDDALFKLSEGRVAEVHLTWAQGEEPDPAWPASRLLKTVEEWASESMVEDHREWIA